MNKITLVHLLFLVLLLMNYCPLVVAQPTSIELSFSAIYNTQVKQLDSIKVRNLALSCDTVLVYPDTVLVLDNISSVHNQYDAKNAGFRLEQNSPNPFKGETNVKLHMAFDDDITFRVCDLQGKSMFFIEKRLQAGTHSFTFIPGQERFLMVIVSGERGYQAIKMITDGGGGNGPGKLLYTGFESGSDVYKTTTGVDNFIFNPGDELMLIGYNQGDESAVTAAPESSQFIQFQFATNITCPGVSSIVYGGQTYNTIQIRSQCWLKENINFEIEESWCIYNNPDNCEEYGRLYLWESAMGICPEGWHLPSDNEWRILEAIADEEFGVLDPQWNYSGGWRGSSAGTVLKSVSGWYGGGNGLDSLGFDGRAGGYQLPTGGNGGASIEVGYWTSTEGDEYTAWYRMLQFSKVGVYRYPDEKEWGLYARCLKD